MMEFCVSKAAAMRSAQAVIDSLSDEELDDYSLNNEDSKNNAVVVLADLIKTEVQRIEDENARNERLDDVEKNKEFLKETLTVDVYEDELKQAEENLNSWNAKYGNSKVGRIFEISIGESSEAQKAAASIIMEHEAINKSGIVLLHVEKEGEGKDEKVTSIRAIVRKPIVAAKSRQQQTVARLSGLAARQVDTSEKLIEENKAKDDAKNKEKKWVGIKNKIPEGWHDTGIRKIRVDKGHEIVSQTVTSTTEEWKEDQRFPVLASYTGDAFDAVGRKFFDKGSNLYDSRTGKLKEGEALSIAVDEILNEYTNYKKEFKVGALISKNGVINLINDFVVLEERLKKEFKDDNLRFVSSHITLLGKIKDNADAMWNHGVPDLFVVDSLGKVHIIDFKTLHASKDILGYSNVLVNDAYKREEKYGKQLCMYIKMLEAEGFEVDQNPYVVICDTFYDSHDYGPDNKYDEEGNLKDGDKVVYKRKVVDGNTIWVLDDEDETPITEYAQRVMEGQRSEEEGTEKNAQNIYFENSVPYLEPRLHIAIDPKDRSADRGQDALKSDVLKRDNTVSYEKMYDEASQQDRDNYSFIGGTVKGPKRTFGTEGMNKMQHDALYSRPDLISEKEVRELANMIMYELYWGVESLAQGDTDEDIYEAFKNIIGNAKGKSHEEIINKIGIQKLLDFTYDSYKKKFNKYKHLPDSWEKYQNDEKAQKAFRLKSEEEYNAKVRTKEIIKFVFAQERKQELLRAGYQKLSALEKSVYTYVENSNPNEKEDRPNIEVEEDSWIDAEVPDDNDDGENSTMIEDILDGNTPAEAWMLGTLTRSQRTTLAQEIRSLYETIPLKTVDDKGNGRKVIHPIWGGRMPIDAKKAIEATREAVKNCETYEEMETALNNLALNPANYWAKDVLEKLNNPKLTKMQRDMLKAKFFVNFRRDANLFTCCTYRFNDVTGEQEIITQIVNRRSAFDTLRESLAHSFMIGEVGEFYFDGSDSPVSIITMVNGKPRLRKYSSKGTVVSIIKSRANDLRTLCTGTLMNRNSARRKGLDYVDYAKEQLTEYKTNDGKTFFAALTSLLHSVGVMVSEQVVQDACISKLEANPNDNVVLRVIDNIVNVCKKLEEANNYGTVPVGLKGNKAYAFYQPLISLFSEKVQEEVEAGCYHNNKTYYTYSNPSKLQHVVRNLQDAANDNAKFRRYIQREFGRYLGWFKTSDGNYWSNDWVDQLSNVADARKALKHKIELSYLNTEYRDLGSLGYLCSLLANYFGSREDQEENPLYRWFAVPTMSNKPTSEFIRMLIYHDHDDIIDKVLMNTFQQECNRIADVLYHFTTNLVPTKNMDLKEKDVEGAGLDVSDLKERIAGRKIGDIVVGGHSITVDDLRALLKLKSGAKFHFLWYLNDEILHNDEFAKEIVAKINNLLTPKDSDNVPVLKDETSVNNMAREIIAASMEKIVDDEYQEMVRLGITETDNSGKLIYQAKFSGKLGGNKEGNEKFKDLGQMEKELKEFIWQDIAANINIIQITGGDLALYGNSVNYQKRIAQIHAPGLHMMNLKEYTDGYLRSVHILDQEMKSEIIESTEYALRSYMENNIDEDDVNAREEYEKEIEIVMSYVGAEFDATDGQSLNSPTSMRKKLASQGKWNEEIEEAYNKIRKDKDLSIQNLQVLMQALKPFVTADVAKISGSPTMTIRKNVIQDKNSEFMLLIAEAIMTGSGKRNKLSAIYEFLEETAFDKDGKYNRHGIDAAHFNSVNKVGLSGYIDMNKIDKDYEKAVASGKIKEDTNKAYVEFVKNAMLEIISRKNVPQEIIDMENSADLSEEEKIYNNQYVDTFLLDEYIIQQEAPVHDFDDERLFGSQIRVLGISDISPNAEFELDGKVVGRDAFIEEYKRLHAANIDGAFDTLVASLGLDAILDSNALVSPELLDSMKYDGTNEEEANKRDAIYKNLRNLLQREMAKDMRYGLDMRRACELMYDSNGHVIDFVTPLYDPIQSNRVQMLLNSIIKKAINKQRIKGISLIQTAAYSNRLHIRFKGKVKNDKGEWEEVPLKTFAEFAESKNWDIDFTKEKYNKYSKDKEYRKYFEEYKKYLKDNHASIAYYECYMPVPDPILEALITKPDGTLMTIDEIKSHLGEEMWENISQSIGYRIPTEDKYSGAPLKIVGFLPRGSGQSIMLPQEIVPITGSDFDFDKMYVMLKAFNVSPLSPGDRKTIVNKVKKIYPDISRNFTKEVADDIERIFNNVNRIINGDKSANLYEGLTANKIEVLGDLISSIRNQILEKCFKPIKYGDKTNSKKDEKSARDNRILDMLWKVLTHEDTLPKILNPGNFKEIERVALINEILTENITKPNGEFWTKDELNKIYYKEGPDGLSALIENANPHNTTLPTSKLYFQRQNMQGTQMVGIFANNNVSHAVCSEYNIAIDLNKGRSAEHKYAFELCGVTIGDMSRPVFLDRQRGFNGQLISKVLAKFLASSVDTASNPLLAKINVDTFTGNVACLLARLGFSIENIGDFLGQPVIKELSALYFKNSVDKYYDGVTAIRDMAEKMGISRSYLESSDGINSGNTLSSENLTIHLHDRKSDFMLDGKERNASKKEDNDTFQARVLKAFYRLTIMSNDLKELTFCTKYNSVSNAVGPFIADTQEDSDRVTRFQDDIDKTCFYVPSEEEQDKYTNPATIIDVDPILSSFYHRTAGPRGAAELLMGCFFPHYYKQFLHVVEHFKENYTRKGKLNAKLRNALVNDFVYYVMTYRNNSKGITPCLPSSTEDLKYLVEGMIDRFNSIVKDRENKRKKGEEVKPNVILDQGLDKNCLRIRYADSYCKIDLLNIGTSRLDADSAQDIREAWSELITSNDPAIKSFGIDLFFYMLMRNGFTFSPKTMMNLASVIVREEARYGDNFSEYLNSSRSLYTTVNDMFDPGNDSLHAERFCNQFIRNHVSSSTVIPNVKKASHEKNIIPDVNSIIFSVAVGKENQLYYIMGQNRNPMKFITVTYVDKDSKKLKRDLYVLKTGLQQNGGFTTVEYGKVQELGMVNNFKEYNANIDIEESFFAPHRGESYAVVAEEGGNTDVPAQGSESVDFDVDEDQWDAIGSVIKGMEGVASGSGKEARSYRRKLRDAYRNAIKTGNDNLVKSFESLLSKSASDSARQETLNNLVKKVLEIENIC